MFGTNSSEIKSHNLNAILQSLLRQEGLSRVALAQQLKVSSATITNLVTELRDAGLVREDGIIKNHVGRPQKALQLIENARSAIGIHLDVGKVHIAITNLRAETQEFLTLEHPLPQDPDPVLAKIAEKVRHLIHTHPTPIVGMGIAASGLVNPENGVNIYSPNLNWRNVPLQDYFASRFDLPVTVDNNVRAMALGEALFGASAQTQVLAFVYARMGVGSGLVINHQLYHGWSAGAGEIGHIIMQGDRFCQDQESITLEQLIAEPALLQQAKQMAAAFPHSLFAQTFLATPKLETLFQIARQSDPQALNIVETCACYMGLGLANLVNLFNPQVIVLGGIFAQGNDVLLPLTEKVMRQKAFANLGEQVQLKVSTFRNKAGVVGAAALALDRFFYRSQSELSL